MGFPPNYSQERRNREKAKQQKTQEKQQKRDEQSGIRKREDSAAVAPTDKDTFSGQA